MPADVGVIGVGQMGSGIARQLAAAGRLAAVFHTDAASARSLGLPKSLIAATAAEMANLCRFVLFVVPGSAEIDGILTGDSNLLGQIQTGTVLIDLTTSDPTETRRLARLTQAAGGSYLDCGMTGGAIAADAGTLTLMVGGEAEALDLARPVLDVIAQRIFHLGPSGAGHTMKLIHNLVCHTVFLATCEGARLAEQAGLPLDRTIEVFNAGNARSFASEVRFPKHIVSGKFDGRSRVANLAKDVGMGIDLAGRLDQPLAISRAADLLLRQAIEQGLSDEDFSRLYPALTDLIAGVSDRERELAS
ncbi:MAG: NAD(P)-dependent oxidoreductase [Pseudomonadota bacterium]